MKVWIDASEGSLLTDSAMLQYKIARVNPSKSDPRMAPGGLLKQAGFYDPTFE